MALLVKNLIFTVLVPGTVAVYVPLLMARDRSPASGATFVIGLALLVAGIAIYAWCVWDFATFGRGTPAPIDAPKNLVVRGLYRYTRNPMYVGVLTVILGWATLFGAANLALYALVVGNMLPPLHRALRRTPPPSRVRKSVRSLLLTGISMATTPWARTDRLTRHKPGRSCRVGYPTCTTPFDFPLDLTGGIPAPNDFMELWMNRFREILSITAGVPVRCLNRLCVFSRPDPPRCLRPALSPSCKRGRLQPRPRWRDQGI